MSNFNNCGCQERRNCCCKCDNKCKEDKCCKKQEEKKFICFEAKECKPTCNKCENRW